VPEQSYATNAERTGIGMNWYFWSHLHDNKTQAGSGKIPLWNYTSPSRLALLADAQLPITDPRSGFYRGSS
jgi:hypothetical protein